MGDHVAPATGQCFTMATARLDATIHGRVQGVGFRFFAERVADRLGVVGFVRNLPTGGVEVVAEGDEEVLQQLLAALSKGPPAAEVSEVKAHWLPATGEFREFGVRFW